MKKIHVTYKFPFFLLAFVLGLLFLYNFSYLFPFTNNAFLVADIRPVAANVNGYITDIFIKNEQFVKKGQPLFVVFRKPYEFTYQKAKSDVNQAKAYLSLLDKEVQKTQHLIQAERAKFEKLDFDWQHYRSALQDHAVSKISVNTIEKDKLAALNQLKALQKQLEVNREAIIVQQHKISSLEAVMNNAKVDLDETIVYAKNNGFIQNMYTALGAPIEIRKPIFSFVDMDHLYIQANLSEIDLRRVRPGNRVTIFPRVYWGTKIYHGVITSNNWAASRQITDPRSQQQIVTNSENNWFLLPQRFPVQIQLLDYDHEHYPLGIGASAYIYINTYSNHRNDDAHKAKIKMSLT